MTRIPIALQLYSVRDDAARDLQGVLAAVADMGYEGVEFAGYYGHDARTIRDWLDAYGLKVAGAHVGIETLLGDELARTIEFHQTLGNTTLIVPGLAEQWRNSRAAWLTTAETLNAIAVALKPYGMRTGYHNHHIEFAPMEGELPWDTLFSNTTDDVIMQFDTGNALHGGAQAAPFLRRYPGRAKTVHLKEYSATNDSALIGEGDVPWNEIFELCETIGGTEWYIVEQESYAYPPLECVRRCLQALKAMGK
ncbi:sugar phosphate isomerase/epimerase family protein [Roseiflexus castenholzii]|jgi:sugar phosphate isomerase/epimerase|uniref:Xylose isomerase domain protein TIM barrel n=1 Tax=Roseiflexus castenholzii (strain DSM 13941 / HLO8) TaxID=383372 RepID=A7NHC1_ROSCS|nr:sugar phosphate isomerase/epimerase [Roseiflexus castenholzii]ABU56868.1 Xylose isomerase domain protein TIM barrel [Roseiflexus castenholzii DSM 13941]